MWSNRTHHSKVGALLDEQSDEGTYKTMDKQSSENPDGSIFVWGHASGKAVKSGLPLLRIQPY